MIALDSRTSSQPSKARIRYTVDLDYTVDASADFVLHIAAAITPQQQVLAESVEGIDRVRPHRAGGGYGDRLLRTHAGVCRDFAHLIIALCRAMSDPSGISPTTGLIRIGTGRDAADVAFAPTAHIR